MIRYLSICSGIESASVAWHSLGWKPMGFSEIDPFACAVLSHRFPTVPNYGSMLTYKEWPIEKGDIDLIVAGCPCQSFSVAGLRRGLQDPRGNLTLALLGLIERFGPRWVVYENVPGLLSSNGGRDFGAFLGALGELGYGRAYRVLDAQWVRVGGWPKAVPQRRRRVFVVGCLGDRTAPARVLFERESVQRDPAPRGGAGEEAPGDAGEGASGGGLHETVGALCADTHPGCYSGQDAYTGRLIPQLVADVAAPSVRASAGSSGFHEMNHPVVAQGVDLYQITAPVNRQRRAPVDPCHTLARDNAAHAAVVECIPINMQSAAKTGKLSPNGLGIGSADDPAPTLSTGDRHAVAIAIQERAVSENPANGPQGKGFSDTGEAFTLEARNKVQAVAFTTEQTPKYNSECALTLTQQSPSGGGQPQCVLHAAALVRRLTPRECEKLMGLPPDWTLVPYRGKPAKDGPRYKACGNSMACNVMAWIGRRIDAVDRGTPLP